MAKKKSKTRRRREQRKRVSNMSDKDWEEWGKKFGKRMERRGKDFAEEFGDLGDRISERFERRGRRWEERWERDWHPFGVIGPFLGSLFAIIVLAVVLFILNFLNVGLGSTFVSALTAFLSANLSWIFLASLFFGYCKFVLRKAHKARWFFLPIVTSSGIAFAAWLLGGVLGAINVAMASPIIGGMSAFLLTNVFGIFIVFLILGYAAMILGKFFEAIFWD